MASIQVWNAHYHRLARSYFADDGLLKCEMDCISTLKSNDQMKTCLVNANIIWVEIHSWIDTV
jgi:hypothetical protein